MQVTKKEAVAMFRKIGYKTAGKWDDERLVLKLNRLPMLLEDTPDILETIKTDENHICNRICKAVEGDEKIELIQEGDAKMVKTKKAKSKRGRIMSIAEYEGREETGKKTKVRSKKTKSEKPVKKDVKVKVKSKKVKGERKGLNKFGYRENSKAGMVDALLSKSPITAKEIAKKLKGKEIEGKKPIDEDFVIRHLNHAIDEGRGVKYVEGKGFSATI
jgi:hypothetical protein